LFISASTAAATLFGAGIAAAAVMLENTNQSVFVNADDPFVNGQTFLSILVGNTLPVAGTFDHSEGGTSSTVDFVFDQSSFDLDIGITLTGNPP
jgi:hypothetical protein